GDLAAARVLEGFAGAEQRLLAHDAEPAYLDHLAGLVLDVPVATDELRRHLALVADGHRIGEGEGAVVGRRLLRQVLAAYADADSIARIRHRGVPRGRRPASAIATATMRLILANRQ